MELKYKSYNEMPLRIFNKIIKLDNSEPIDFEIELLSILCDCSFSDIMNLSLTEYQHLREQAQFIADVPKAQAKTPDKLVINKHKYKVCKDLKQITTGQYIDYQTYLKMDDRKYEYLLSCFIIPENKIYNEGYNIDDVIKDILELDIVTCLNICFFFLNLYLTSTYLLVNYWELKLKKMIKKEKNQEMKQKLIQTQTQIHSLINGAGLT